MREDSAGSRDVTERAWWAGNATSYRVDTRAFSDADGDGIGDLEGLRRRLGYLELLGVGALWLTGLFASPVGKPGHSRDVDPLVGTRDSLELLVSEAHLAGIRITVDLAVSRTGIREPGAAEELERTLRLWLDLGIDGIRLAIPGLTRAADESTRQVLEYVRPIVDRYPRRLVGALVERWFTERGTLRGLDVGMDLRFPVVAFEATEIRETIRTVLADSERAGATPAWILSDWENPRPVTRLGGGTAGLARARAMTLVHLALPGLAGIDHSQELGLSDPERPDRASRNPVRTLMPWEGTQPPFGFSEASGIWWPTSAGWADLTVERQLENPASTLSLYRRAIELRHDRANFPGDHVEWYGAPAGCLAFRRNGGGLTCALNTSNEPVSLPPGELVLASEPLDDARFLPPATAVWLA